jgi:hypothetical protein
MLDVALKHEVGIDQYTKANMDTLDQDFLDPGNWETLRTVREFLTPFHAATMKLQGHGSCLGDTLVAMDVLIQHMDNSLKTFRSDPDLKARITKAWEKFDEYYARTAESPLYAAALILHPQYRTAYIKQFWRKDWQKPALRSVQELWKRFLECLEQPATPSSVAGAQRMQTRLHETSQETEEIDEFDKIMNRIEGLLIGPKTKEEYEDYCSEPPIRPGCSALQWWLQEAQRNRFPKLSIFAIDILTIPAMSDEPERVFSSGRRTVRWDRTSLSEIAIEMTECMKSWQKSGILVDET